MIAIAAAVFALALPVHGTVLARESGVLIVRTQAVTGMLPAMTRAYRTVPRLSPPIGAGLDGFLDRSRIPWRLTDAVVAAPFVAGLPDAGKTIPIDVGSALPRTRLVDQNGRMVDLRDGASGKTALISFVFTRCPDKSECPAVSSKFRFMQSKLDLARFHFYEITLDPQYDSPWVLARYARQFGARAQSWQILTGRQHEIQQLLDRFGISSLRVSDANFIHNDKVFIVAPNGQVATIVQTIGFAPEAMIAQARHIAGLESSPLGRIELGLIASVVAFCGGSQYTGVVLLETVLVLIIAALSFAALGWVAKKLWRSA